jgi:hypothetical protein
VAGGGGFVGGVAGWPAGVVAGEAGFAFGFGAVPAGLGAAAAVAGEVPGYTAGFGVGGVLLSWPLAAAPSAFVIFCPGTSSVAAGVSEGV